jgi:uncharacterized protein (DUF952 family)
VTAQILHAALPEDWAAARRAGSFAVSTRARALADEGFIHASTAAQVDGVLQTFYADIDEIVLLVLDPDALSRAGSAVRWEPVPGAPAPFPHIYGEIPVSVVGQGNPVTAAIPVSREPTSAPWQLEPLLPSLVLTESVE